ncbi:MAG: capsule biosynthesis protein, partial [Pseudomonadota bacterium]
MQHDPELQRQAEQAKTLGKFVSFLKRWRWLAACVVLPSAMAVAYYGLIAADIYVSESRFVIKAPERNVSAPSTIGSLLQSTGLGSGAEQSSEIIGYLRSRDALSDLSKKTDVRAAFASNEADILSRFPTIL